MATRWSDQNTCPQAARGEKINARRNQILTEQVSRKLKYLYTDHNARPHTVTKRLVEDSVRVRKHLSSVCQLTPRDRVTNLTAPQRKSPLRKPNHSKRDEDEKAEDGPLKGK